MPDFDIEQINRVRKAMGMPLLPVPGGDSGPSFKADEADAASDEEPASTLETREAAAGDNWQRLQADRDANAKREAQKASIKKARDAAQRFAQLEGKGLADEDDAVDAKSWLRGQKKRQAAIDKARKYEQELAEREQQAQYTSADLAGVKVGHQLNQFDEEAGEQILTLKDAAVDAESDDDELENVDLRDQEKVEERQKSKIKKPAYNPIEDSEENNSILAQYDEEIDGKKKQRFTLDGQGSTREAVTQLADGSEVSKGVTINLDMFKDDAPISDYKDAAEVKIRKPKKSKSKVKKRKAEDEDDIFTVPGGTDVEMANGDDQAQAVAPKKRRKMNDAYVDDEDLQANLAAQRTAALKKRKKRTPEDIAREIREEASATPGVQESVEDDTNEPGMIIDETSEFLANLQVPTREERRRISAARSASRGASAGADVKSSDEDEDMADVVKEESSSQAILREKSTPTEVTATGLEEEADLNRGLGASLNLLKQRGVIKSAEEGDVSAVYRERQRFLAEKHKREEDAERRARAQRERDRVSGRTANMSAKQREDYARQMNTQRDQIESRQMAEIFNREYKPNIELKYTDEYGRSLNQKEAFKHLSHQFHGKGSGKQKTEKTLKKIEDEKKREAMSVLDASQNATNMNSVAGERSKRNRQAGVRLQ